MKSVLITGLAGFVGSHLVDHLLQDSATEIVGVIHPSHEIRHLETHPRVRIVREDILKGAKLNKILKQAQPEEVYNLAGLAHVHESWHKRKDTIHTNFLGAFNLLEACRKLPAFPKTLLIGSADCYGIVPENEQPITESRPLVPSSPYAVSKIAQEILGVQYGRTEKLPVFLSRSFNHTGPRQKETFVCSAFARQVAAAETTEDISQIRVGNLDARRDFSDVRDVVRAYTTIVRKGVPGEPYNVCSGSAISIGDVLRKLVSFSDHNFEVVPDPEKFRPSDLPLLLGSSQKLREHTGWAPVYDIDATLSDLLNYWRAQLKSPSPVTL